MASTTADEPEPVRKIREALGEMREEILTKFDEVIRQTRIQMENINKEMKETVEKFDKKTDPDFETQAREICQDAYTKVKDIQAETESHLQKLWSTTSAAIQNTSKSLSAKLKIESLEAFIVDLCNNIEKVFTELLEHLNILTIYIIQEQQIFMEKLKIKLVSST